jgi:hypothetical protein
MPKFKVGDLVMLSAAGKKINQNDDAIGGWGIVKMIKLERLWRLHDWFPIKTEWYDGKGFGKDFMRDVEFKPYELKFFKKSS